MSSSTNPPQQLLQNDATISNPTTTGNNNLQRNVYVRIVEEPASKALRFRYECEGRSAGSLPGANSTQDKKSFPKIQVLGYRGRAVLVLSCVTIEPQYRPHPHNLVGKEGCKKGVCTMEIANDDMTCEFSNLGIQCVKKKDIEDSLKIREEIRVDPFRTGFHHKSQPGSIDLNSLRLCFQVFLEGPERGQFKVPLKPVVSEAIYDKKAINDLTIMKLSDCTSPVMGNKEIILLCDKVSKDDIEVRFYEESEETGAVVWESFGDFQPSDVHKQYAICFRTPQYHNLEITTPSRVFIQLRCPSKDTTSAPRPFQYIPLLTSGNSSSASKRKWNLVSFSGAYGCYITAANETTITPNDSPTKKVKTMVELEDILAATDRDVNMGSEHDDDDDIKVEEPIYDRLNQFMGISDSGQVLDSDSAREIKAEVAENVYDVDLELISQIITAQENNDMMVGIVDEKHFDELLNDPFPNPNNDLINGNEPDDTDLKRKRLKPENCRNLTLYFENNKRPRQNSYPPAPTLQQLPSPTRSIHQLQPSSSQQHQHQPASQQHQLYSQPQVQQPLQLPSLQQAQPQVYIKQEQFTTPHPPPPIQQQYYYDMNMMMTSSPAQQPRDTQQAQQLLQYSGGGIILPTSPNNPQQSRPPPPSSLPPTNLPDPENNEEEGPALNSDFSLPNLSDVNLSLLDQHLSENLNDMNLNNF